MYFFIFCNFYYFCIDIAVILENRPFAYMTFVIENGFRNEIIPCVISSSALYVQVLSKMFGQTARVHFSHQNKENIYINIYG